MKNGKHIDEFGYTHWFLNDHLHRTDDPAIIHPNGTQAWYLNGDRHCEDGPAIIHSDGKSGYYINDNHLTENEYDEYIMLKNIKNIL